MTVVETGPPQPAGDPVHDRHETSRWVVLVLVCVAQFMVILDATIVNVALPSIQRDLGFSSADLQWVINSYTLTFGGLLLLGGRAADLVGRRTLFVAGTLLFTAASLVNGLSTSSEMLIVARGVQGIGAALVSPAALSIITTTFPEGADRQKALGVWSAIAAGGGAFGLLLGGILTDSLSWEWIFFVNVPIGIAAAAFSWRLIPESKSVGRRGFDVAGAVSVTAGLIILVYAIVKAQAYGWGSPKTLGLAALALAVLGAFLAIERRSHAPLVRLSIFRTRSLTAANLVLLVVAGGMFALFFFASLYVQEILRFDPLQAGLAFLPVSLMIGVGAGICQQMVRRVGVRPMLIFGMAVASAGLFLLSRVPTDGSYATDLLPGLLLMAFGMGNTFVPITLIATTNVAHEDAGLASGLFNTSQQIGGALGLAVLSTLGADKAAGALQKLGHPPTPPEAASALVDGFHVAFTGAAILMAAGLVLALVLIRPGDVAGINPEAPLVPAAE
jgi:EmrB/QacA subfamily drug resistance transporter